MIYAVTTIVYIFLIISLSNYFKYIKKFDSDLNLVNAFLLISTLLFFFRENSLFILLFLIILFSIAYKNKVIYFDNKTIKFLVYFSIIAIFSYNRYFLDEDELTFWGINSKYLYYLKLLGAEEAFANKYYYIPYHSLLIPSFKSLLDGFFAIQEDVLIVLNNLIILILFFSLFISKKKDNLIFFIYFVIFYLLLNLFSFGLNSIYADIIVVLFSCLIYKKLIYSKFKFSINLNTLNIVVILVFIPLIHRIGYLFIFLILLNYVILNLKYIYLNKYKFITLALLLIVVIFLLISNSDLFYSNQINSLSIDLNLISSKFFLFTKQIVYFDTPYIKLFSLINDFFSFLKFNIQLPGNNIKIYHIIVIYIVINFLFFKESKYLYLNLLNFIIFFLVVFITKNLLENNLHAYASVRYLMLFFLFDFVLKLSLKFRSFYSKKYITQILFILILLSPSKSVGFFLPQKVYLFDKNNNEYYLYLSRLKEIKKKYQPLHNHEFFLVTDGKLSSIETSRLIYEFYPVISKENNKTISIKEFENFSSNSEKKIIFLSDENLINTKKKFTIEKIKK